MSISKPPLEFEADLRKNNTVLVPEHLISYYQIPENARIKLKIEYFYPPKPIGIEK